MKLGFLKIVVVMIVTAETAAKGAFLISTGYHGVIKVLAKSS